MQNCDDSAVCRKSVKNPPSLIRARQLLRFDCPGKRLVLRAAHCPRRRPSRSRCFAVDGRIGALRSKCCRPVNHQAGEKWREGLDSTTAVAGADRTVDLRALHGAGIAVRLRDAQGDPQNPDIMIRVQVSGGRWKRSSATSISAARRGSRCWLAERANLAGQSARGLLHKAFRVQRTSQDAHIPRGDIWTGPVCPRGTFIPGNHDAQWGWIGDAPFPIGPAQVACCKTRADQHWTRWLADAASVVAAERKARFSCVLAPVCRC